MNKNNVISIERRFFLSLVALAIAILIVSAAGASAFDQLSEPSQTADQANDTDAPNWLEPRPLSVVDLISGGFDPDLLAGTPVAWLPGQALLQFTSGAKTANGVNVTGKMLPPSHNVAFCLGKFGIFDQWPVVVPESKILIRSNGVDITNKIDFIEYWPAGLTQPTKNATQLRYETQVVFGSALNFTSDGRLAMPANSGCKINFFPGAADGGNITIEYEHDLTHYVSVNILEQVNNYEFKSYYVDEDQNFGHLVNLNRQISSLKASECPGCSGSRHDKYVTVPPSEANYVLMTFDPVLIDPYAPLEKLQSLKRYEGSGTYRLRENKADFRDVSVDWITSVGIPMNFHTKDADFSSGETYLDFFKVLGEYRIHALEVVAINQEYDSCMTNGGCSVSLLNEISGTRMNVDIYFLKVDRIAPGLTQIPLCSVGPSWSPSDAGTKCNDYRIARSGEADFEPKADLNSAALVELPNKVISSNSASSPFAPEATSFIYLPVIFNPVAVEPDNPTADCPCGWFAADGRMLGYVEPPGS